MTVSICKIVLFLFRTKQFFPFFRNVSDFEEGISIYSFVFTSHIY